MPVDPLLSQYSDLLFEGTVVVYLLAMVFSAVEYVTARQSTPAAEPAEVVAVAATSAEPAAVSGSAGSAGSAADEIPPPPVRTPKPERSRADRFGRMAVSLTILGVLLHLGSIALRGLAAERWPLGNMYEYTSAVCLAAMVAWLVVLQRGAGRSRGIRRLGVFLYAPILVLMVLAGTVLYAQAAPVVPALQSYWLVIHVTTITLSTGLFIVPGVASILYLMKRSGRPAGFVAKLPAQETLDRLAYRTTVVAFPMFTFAVICGAIWAEAAWGRFWGWDPKETVAFISWVVYAAYLHARATAGWRHAPAAWINIVGLATVIFNLFFVNMVIAGLHSYAGLG
ncbi:c-type cytochrome biogenesis protein CcsB [Pseudonocardia sp. WMMC193]|uniref:c-type cytochrome biogenesis protein CcsB n=1 Tax=Pseudonocardia sp. WMMC193 TaxID=2911965 RepID=UPI001F005FBA|nr:c-type cytochrome biogenesis protein CcsB [Pseudonocardia sp. WMMC193]MCF7552949.1 c-type cytochrome biogenesis protein CcsB [Pseudonocardia sp. WMMC193]